MGTDLSQTVSHSVPPPYKSAHGWMFRNVRLQRQAFEPVVGRIGEPMIVQHRFSNASVSANRVNCGKALGKRLSGCQVSVPDFTSSILHILYLLLRNWASPIFGVYCHTRVDEFKTCTTVVIA